VTTGAHSATVTPTLKRCHTPPLPAAYRGLRRRAGRGAYSRM